MQRSIVKVLLLAILSATGSAFVPKATPRTTLSLKSSQDESNGFTVSPQIKVAAFTTLVTVSQPLVALAETYDDNYEYGAVSAPPLVPIVGGILAILTALLPIALQGGEEAFEEMKEDGTFGSGKDVLGSRRK